MKERFNDISILRCSAMLVVVFYHCICAYGVWSNPAYSVAQHVPIWDILYDIMRNIHMPMFFILAGYLFGYKRHVGGGTTTSENL